MLEAAVFRAVSILYPKVRPCAGGRAQGRGQLVQDPRMLKHFQASYTVSVVCQSSSGRAGTLQIQLRNRDIS